MTTTPPGAAPPGGVGLHVTGPGHEPLTALLGLRDELAAEVAARSGVDRSGWDGGAPAQAVLRDLVVLASSSVAGLAEPSSAVAVGGPAPDAAGLVEQYTDLVDAVVAAMTVPARHDPSERRTTALAGTGPVVALVVELVADSARALGELSS